MTSTPCIHVWCAHGKLHFTVPWTVIQNISSIQENTYTHVTHNSILTSLAESHHGHFLRKDEQHEQGQRMAGAASHGAPSQQVCCMPEGAEIHVWSNPFPAAHSHQTASPCKEQTL